MKIELIMALLNLKPAGYHQQASLKINNEQVHTQVQNVVVTE